MLLTAKEFEDARDAGYKSLAELAQQLKGLEYPATMVHMKPVNLNALEGLDRSGMSALLKDVPSKKDDGVDYVYILRANSDAIEEVGRLADCFGQIRTECKGFSRINAPNHSGSATLYVGRSKKLRERLSQHFGVINKNSKSPTYALWLRTWCGGHDLDITVSYMRFEGLDHLLVQAVEDGLWSSLKPVFGRRGDK